MADGQPQGQCQHTHPAQRLGYVVYSAGEGESRHPGQGQCFALSYDQPRHGTCSPFAVSRAAWRTAEGRRVRGRMSFLPHGMRRTIMGYRLDSMLVRRPFPHYQDVREALQEQPCESLGITGCEQDKPTTSKWKRNARLQASASRLYDQAPPG